MNARILTEPVGRAMDSRFAARRGLPTGGAGQYPGVWAHPSRSRALPGSGGEDQARSPGAGGNAAVTRQQENGGHDQGEVAQQDIGTQAAPLAGRPDAAAVNRRPPGPG